MKCGIKGDKKPRLRPQRQIRIKGEKTRSLIFHYFLSNTMVITNLYKQKITNFLSSYNQCWQTSQAKPSQLNSSQAQRSYESSRDELNSFTMKSGSARFLGSMSSSQIELTNFLKKLSCCLTTLSFIYIYKSELLDLGKPNNTPKKRESC